MFTEVGSRDDALRQRHSIVLQVHQLQLGSNVNVVIDASGEVVEEFDDLLGDMVARCRLASYHHGPGYKRRLWIAFYTIVHDDAVKAVQQLTLVLVNTLHLDVKDGADIQMDSIRCVHELGQFTLVALFDQHDLT